MQRQLWHTNTATFELDRSICSRDLRSQFFVYQQSPLSTRGEFYVFVSAASERAFVKLKYYTRSGSSSGGRANFFCGIQFR